jgi:hypothetical protein
MERSVDEAASSRFRTILSGVAAPWEVTGIAVGTAVAWRLTLGWNWSGVTTGNPVRTVAPQTDLDWLVLGVVVAAGVGWLARRGSPVAGAVAIWTPIIVLSGWRLVAAGVVGWPVSLASLIFVVSAICIIAGGAGAWFRHRSQWRGPETYPSISEQPESADPREAPAASSVRG